MKKVFELMSTVGLIGYFICRIFFYEESVTARYIFSGVVIIGLIGRIFLGVGKFNNDSK